MWRGWRWGRIVTSFIVENWSLRKTSAFSRASRNSAVEARLDPTLPNSLSRERCLCDRRVSPTWCWVLFESSLNTRLSQTTLATCVSIQARCLWFKRAHFLLKEPFNVLITRQSRAPNCKCVDKPQGENALINFPLGDNRCPFVCLPNKSQMPAICQRLFARFGILWTGSRVRKYSPPHFC